MKRKDTMCFSQSFFSFILKYKRSERGDQTILLPYSFEKASRVSHIHPLFSQEVKLRAWETRSSSTSSG